MPRRREGSIRESLEDLQRLEAQYRGKPEATRITVLRLLKEDPNLGIESVGALVGYSKPTVKRWWRAYREGGLEAVIKMTSRHQPRPDEGMILLKQKVLAGEFADLKEVENWLDAYRAGRHGRARSRAIVGGDVPGARRTATAEKGGGMAAEPHPPLTAERLLQFVSSLPMTHDIQSWSASFREALQKFLGDVDRVSITLNVQCDLINPEKYRPDIIISQSIHSGSKAVNPILEGTDKDGREHLNRLMDNLRRRSFPFSNYHDPYTFVYYHGGHAYLGLIALWRDREKSRISKDTIDAMERLRGFFTYILSDFVARYQITRPIDNTFNHALAGVTAKTGLTMQERRIMILQLLGLSYEEVASTLNISLNTVRYHLRSIYSKTGAHSQAELFAKYFTPRYDPNQSTG